MKFKINNRNWEIKEVSQKEIKEKEKEYYNNGVYNNPVEDGRYFGITYHDEQLILIDKDLHPERKRITLMHELTHCYINCFMTHQDFEYNEEFVCDIVANSHDIIHDITNEYFKNMEYKVE